jgi:acyl dehydratase
MGDGRKGRDILRAMTVHERPYGRYFEDFEVGDLYRHWPGKTITESDDHLICLLTMNHHPLHLDDYFAEQSQFGRNIVAGPVVYSLVFGMSIPRSTATPSTPSRRWSTRSLPRARRTGAS